ncbi:helix-turn-helix transcriptional regulator [Bremerella sp. P1]|uniref:helix-turn-helix transcriptional regulator n=1 Tax=Bremerella sp. P1 TaxID=3026424 RepID=UPI0023686FDC|nr:AlpA family phage regulatory protein [Bremerella sp. P1]WDI39871.1 AlpA family phage regulatory protein [Bremerella sp. P1]
MNEVQKAAVSVSEMARIVGLSRARFYQLMSEGVFPKPKYDDSNSRPYYDEDMQAECIQVKRRNVGVNGKVVMFYGSRHPLSGQSKRRPRRKTTSKPASEYTDLIDSLSCLGLSATAQQVEAAVAECFPDGIQKLDSGEVVRAVFLHLKRKESER